VLIVGRGRLQAVRLPRPVGAIVGLEPDIAKLVADKLGVKLEIERGRLVGTACSSCSKARST